ncbi:hypothetical protein A0H81_03128, partial [Grifola frondosa]
QVLRHKLLSLPSKVQSISSPLRLPHHLHHLSSLTMSSSHHLMRKSSNVENTPPRTKRAATSSKVTRVSATSIRDGALRRRTRGVVASAFTRNAIRMQERRKLAQAPPVSVEIAVMPTKDVEMASAQPGPRQYSRKTVQFPRVLKHAEVRDVARDAIDRIDPELKNIPTQYIRDGLESLGVERYSHPSCRLRTKRVHNRRERYLLRHAYPRSGHLRSPMPAPAPPEAERRRVTLFPIHHLVFAAHCARFPLLEISRVDAPTQPGSEITLPVVPFCLPHPDSFGQLASFLYSRRGDLLLSQLLPSPPPTGHPGIVVCMPPAPSTTESTLNVEFARRLAGTFTPHALFQYLMHVNGLWRNACALGVFEETLWAVIDVAWDILLNALNIASGATRATRSQLPPAEPAKLRVDMGLSDSDTEPEADANAEVQAQPPL